MTGHHHRLPRRGGEWRPDPQREGLLHRGGNPWDHVRLPPRSHRCVSQSKLEWTIDTSSRNHVAAIRWCACGGLTYPGVDGRWLGKNMRRTYSGATLPVWHRAMLDLHGGPATVFARPRVWRGDLSGPGWAVGCQESAPRVPRGRVSRVAPSSH